MYVTIYGNIYRETLWEVNMEYMPEFELALIRTRFPEYAQTFRFVFTSVSGRLPALDRP